jgi:hypothetical protein
MTLFPKTDSARTHPMLWIELFSPAHAVLKREFHGFQAEVRIALQLHAIVKYL